jgi:hypothetical protein
MSTIRDDNKKAGVGSLPLPVRRALLRLGKDIRQARIYRRIPMEVMAGRALMTRMTLYKIERGDPTVSVGAYATVLFVLGMIDRFAEIADSTNDEVGKSLYEERLPQRIRQKSPFRNQKTNTDEHK